MFPNDAVSRRYPQSMKRLTRMVSFSLDAATALTTMTASGCLPCDSLAAAPSAPVTPAAAPPEPPAQGAPLSPRWEGVIGVEGEMTGDGRLIELNALTWDVPFPLRYVDEDLGAHDGAVVVGRVNSVERRDGGILWGTGDFDTKNTVALKAQRQVGEEFVNGVSMDLDDVSFEVRIAAELLDPDGEIGLPMMLASEKAPVDGHKVVNGKEVECDPEVDGDCVPDEMVMEIDSDGRVKVLSMKADDEVRVTTSGRIRAATIVAIPAFARAQIHLSADVEGVSSGPALVAAAAPVRPPIDWFKRPGFTGPTPLAVSDEGRVQGHIALWDTCHTSHTAQGQCIKPPRSATGYAYFLTGAVLTKEGTEVPVGHLTLDTLHAGDRLSAAETIAHYEKTGMVAADVMVGEDEWGIWVAGACRSNLSDANKRALRASPISGDWRRLGGTLELVAALAVVVPGFPVPRPHGLVASGEVQSLLASGMLAPRSESGQMGLTLDDLRYLRRLAARERNAEKVDGKALRVHAYALRRRAHRPL